MLRAVPTRRRTLRTSASRTVSRRHDVARSSNLLLRNWKRLEKLLIIGSARSSAPRVAKNVAEGGETVREIVKPKSRRVSGGSRCGGLRASQRGFPSNILSTRPLLGIYHLSSLGWGPTNIPCKGYGACEYTTLRLVLSPTRDGPAAAGARALLVLPPWISKQLCSSRGSPSFPQ